MGKHDFGYFFHEGLSNMFSHGFMSFAAIGITVACLLIMGTFTLVAVNANALLQDLEQENEILAYVDDSYTEEQAKALQSKLEAVPNVASAKFISKEEAMESFAEQYPDESLFQDLDPEIFRDRFAIKITDLHQLSQTAEQVKAVSGIAKVNAYEEIAIMRMVGATNGFIRWPFVYEGFLLGFLSAAIAFFLQWGLYAAVAQGVDTNDTLQLIHIIPFQQLWPAVAGIFAAAGIVIGVGGSLSAIRKFLQV